MKLSVSAYRAHASAHKKILASGYHSQHNYGSTGAATSSTSNTYRTDFEESINKFSQSINRMESNSDTDVMSPAGTSSSGQEQIESAHTHHISSVNSSESKSTSQRKSGNGDGASDPESDWNKSNQRWMKLRTTVQISSAIQKKPTLKREDSFLKRFSTRQLPETQETVEDTGSESASGEVDKSAKRRKRYLKKRRSVINPDENFYFYWLMMMTICVLYNLWTLIVRQSFPELQKSVPTLWLSCDVLTDAFFIFDIVVQLRTGYLEQGLMVYDDKKLAFHYMNSKDFFFDMIALIPLDLLQLKMGAQPMLRFTRFLKVYRTVKFYYIVESRTVWPNLWRVVNLIHILLILAHWFGCFYYLLSEAEGFQGEWVYPYRPGDYATLSRKYLGSLYWSTLTLTTIGDLPTPETNAEPNFSVDGPRSIARRGIKSRLLQFGSIYGYLFTIVSYLIGVFIFATIVGQVGNVITNRNANRLEFERLLDGAKTYMRHHKVPGGMKRRVLRWYDYSWSRGRIQGGGDINTALGLLPDKLKTELALHVNLSVLKKVTIFQECQPEFLHDLVLKMKAYIFTPGDSICRKGEVAREMFIIADGILEVISETGKVLTTMKAGDFFGEIGILNLDGLNKRTADVRSVGYSELFSLSREDVLSAMKDYPEAQDILQTLGRKRLMEVRCVNKKFAKAQSEKELAAHNQLHHVVQNDCSENSASKKMVDKLRNDVKGFKSVLKKSRTSRKSIESLEMEPLNSISPKSGKTMLKRMSRVKSDEKGEPSDIEKQHEKTPSTIGAGLPLLQRLRLLKEKQDREERAVKSVAPLKSPPHPHVSCTLSPQESIQEEPEQELNEGLPLIQCVQQNKCKTDVVLSEDISLVNHTLSSNKTESGTPHMELINNNHNGSASSTVAQVKPTMKVSFKQRMQQLQSTRQLKSSHQTNKLIDDDNINLRKEPPKTLSVTPYEPSELVLQNIYPSVTKKMLKPSIILPSSISEVDAPIKPWSKLKLATLISSSNTSLDNCSPGDFKTPVKEYSMGSIPIMMNIEKEKPIRKTSKQRESLATEFSTKSSATDNTLHPSCFNKSKFYNSVFDLSPEYSGLPFVKRLKILNERQKLAELETVLQKRSSSLDCSKKHGELPLSESLYRCLSDTSAIYSQFVSTHESSSTTSTNTSTSESSQRTPTAKSELQNQYTPLNSDLNESCVKKQLKSILKNQHKGSNSLSSQLELRQSGRPNTEPTLMSTPNSANYSAGESEDHQTKDEFKSADSLESNTPTTSSSHYSQQFFKKPTDSNINSPENAFMFSKKMLNLSIDSPTETLEDIEGKTKSQDFFHHMLFGINNAVTSHMNEIHSKLELQFSIMQNEVKRRDDIITNLQNKLRNLELKAISIKGKERGKTDAFSDEEVFKSDENNSESSGELLFMRGDSLDTIFTSSPPIQVDCSISTPSTSRFYSTNTYFTSYKNKSIPSDKESETIRIKKSPCSEIRDYKVTDSAILDIEESSSSSTSSSKSNLVTDDNCEKAMHHNDWELRMLAAELDKQERKRGNSLCDNPKDLKDCSAIFKRRRKISNSESEYSETANKEKLETKRNRAASLDQFNTVYEHGNGIFETIGTDRDKNKL